MIFINVIFQLFYKSTKYLCLVNFNEINYYKIYKSINNNEDVIKIIINSQLNDLEITYDKIYLITTYYENNCFNDINDYSSDMFDIIINNEKQSLKIFNQEINYKEKIKNNQNIDWIQNIYNKNEKRNLKNKELILNETEQKIETIEYFINKFINLDNKKFINKLSLIQASLLCKHYKYQENGKNIKYNFIVTNIYYDKDYDRNCTYKINIESTEDKEITGYYSKVEFADGGGYSVQKDFEIEDIDDKHSEKLFEFLFERIKWYN